MLRSDEARAALEGLDPEPRLLRPWILLLLQERPSHGYDAIKRLTALGYDKVDRVVYRMLATLERDGLVAVSWDTPDAGPARKVYGVTARGEEALESSIRQVAEETGRSRDLAAREPEAGVGEGPARAGGLSMTGRRDESSVEDGEASAGLEDLDRVRSFLRPWILLLLSERPSHGYELIKRVNAVGFEDVDRTVYRTLANLERAGLVTVSWDMPDVGPARKVYALTWRGEDSLDRSVRRSETVVELLNTVARRYRTVTVSRADESGPRWRRRRRAEGEPDAAATRRWSPHVDQLGPALGDLGQDLCQRPLNAADGLDLIG